MSASTPCALALAPPTHLLLNVILVHFWASRPCNRATARRTHAAPQADAPAAAGRTAGLPACSTAAAGARQQALRKAHVWQKAAAVAPKG